MAKRDEEEEGMGLLTPVDEPSIVLLEGLVSIASSCESDGRDALRVSFGVVG